VAPPEATGPSRTATEEIVVTGSRVRRKDLTTPAPVTVLTRQQIQSSAVASVGDFLQMMPEQGNATNTAVNNGGNGTTQISLRSLGASRTLVLVDGKRYVYSGGGADNTVDLNSIPTAAIERIEVLKDGASAIYGSDAIAGVVNIITRRRLNTTEASAYGGTSQHGDGQVYDFSVTSGTTGEKGAFLFGAGYYDQHSFLAGNRDWARYALRYNYRTGLERRAGSINIPQGIVLGLDPSPTSPGNPPCPTVACSQLFAKYGAGADNFIYDPGNPLSTATGFRRFVDPDDRYNYQAINFLITPSQRVSLFTNGEYRLHESARAYFQGSFVNRQSSNFLAPEPLNTDNFGIVLSAANAYNPFGQDISVGKRLVSASGRSASSDIDTFRAVGGLDGTLPAELGPLKGFFYDVSFNYGRSTGTTTTNGSINAISTSAALGPTFTDTNGVPQCGTDAAHQVVGCTPANVFGVANPTAAQLTGLGFEQLVNRGFNQQTEIQANLNGELFPLLSERPIGIAVGYAYRREYGGFIPDAVAAQTFVNPSGFNSFVDSDYGSAATRGSYYVNEGYGELSLPVISGAPGIDDLEASAAVRVFNYSTFGSDATYKFGVRYRPIRDITLRGTYSTAFRAPSVPELFTGVAPSAEPATDPCAAAQSPTGAVAAACGSAVNNTDQNNQINSNVGGNALLQPETAKSLTLGVVIEPQMVRGLSLTADYFHIKVDNLIIGGANSVNGFAQNYLNACYGSGSPVLPDACTHIHRNNRNIIILIDDFNVNKGDLTTDGVDIAARYTTPTDFGRFGFLFDASYLIKYDQNIFSLIRGRGNFDLGVNPSFKFNAGVNYSLAGLSVGVLGHYIGSFRECPSGGGSNVGGTCYANDARPAGPLPYHKVPQEMTFDIFASYLLRNPFGNTTIAAGMRNVLNTDPVRVYNSFLSYADPSAYDFVGRFIYGRVSHAF
jgi:outer membrane receptor protein involved in Fe transport